MCEGPPNGNPPCGDVSSRTVIGRLIGPKLGALQAPLRLWACDKTRLVEPYG
jgi:hypothetical protein